MGSRSFLVAVAAVAFLAAGWLPASFSAAGPEGGAGGRAVVLVHDVYELQNMSRQKDADFELANDIDASATRNWNLGAGFAPLGTYQYQKEFSRLLDGKGFNITGLYINRPSEDMVGFIRLGNGHIRNLNLTNVDITGGNDVGGLAGNNSMVVSNCHVTGRVSGKSHVGGLAGVSAGAPLSNCSFHGTVSAAGDYAGGLVGLGIGTTVDSVTGGTVSGNDNVGGFVGLNWKGSITRCSSSASVKGAAAVGGFAGDSSGYLSECLSTGRVSGTDDVGGLVGYNANENQYAGIISDCYSTGPVTGKNRVGGLVGSHSFLYPERPESNGAEISRCYSAGPVSGNADAGGFLGKLSGGNVTDCYWDMNHPEIGSSAAGTGKSTADMMKKATFLNWDFDAVWKIEEDRTYPYLREAPAPPPNAAPVIATSPARTAAAGSLYSVQYAATDADGDALVWNVSTNASWLGMSSSGLLSGTPSASDIGSYNVAVSVYDGRNGTARQTFELEVSLNRQPLINALDVPGETRVQADKALSFSVSASDPDGDALTYEWQENGVTLSTKSGFTRRFAPGNHSLVLLIGDGLYITRRTFNFTVVPGPPTADAGTLSVPGFGAAVAATAASVAVAGLFWRRERR